MLTIERNVTLTAGHNPFSTPLDLMTWNMLFLFPAFPSWWCLCFQVAAEADRAGVANVVMVIALVPISIKNHCVAMQHTVCVYVIVVRCRRMVYECAT